MSKWRFHDENLAKHGVTWQEVEEALIDRYRILEKGSGGLYLVIGQTDEGRLLELIYRQFSDGNHYVFHAMTARDHYRKRYKKRK